METAGLIVGVVGLAGLFSSCLEAVETIQSYAAFGNDSQALDAQFKATKARFERWGPAVGIKQGRLLDTHHSALDSQEVKTAVEELLLVIKFIYGPHDSGGVPPRRTPAIGLSDAVSSGSQRLQAPHSATSESKRSKLAWAIWRKKGRTEQVELFEKLVQGLHDLVPLEWDRGKQPTREPGSRRADALAPGTTPDHAWRGEIRRILDRIEKDRSAETRQAVHSWLGGYSSSDYYDNCLQKKLVGTCDWILDRSQFLHWRGLQFPAGPKLLWIYGAAGFGKTILCAHVIEHLSSTLETPVAYFFFSSELENRDDPAVAIRSWISQVVSRHDGAFEHVYQRWLSDSDPVATRTTIVALFSHLVQTIPGCTFVADGLDECVHMGDSNKSVVSFLKHVTDAVATTDTRLLLVSRDAPQIRGALTANLYEDYSEYKIVSDDVRSDTDVYSRDIVDRKLSNKRSDVRSTLAMAMTDRCEGQFLWLKLQEESLRRGMNMKQLQQAIEDSPVEIDSLYDREWARIGRLREEAQCRTFALLRWAAFALRPLTICEITEAVIVDQYQDLALDELPDAVDIDYVDTEIVGLCGPLLEVRVEPSNNSVGQQTVHLPHFTIRQYLLRNLPPACGSRQNNHLRISQEQFQHAQLVKVCLRYLSIRRVWQNASACLPTIGVSFRGYAARTWHQHFNLTQRNDLETIKLAIEFLDKTNPAWYAWTALIDSENTNEECREPEYIPPSPLYYAVKLHLIDVASSLITERCCDVNETGSKRHSALGIACTNGSLGIVDLLLEKGADISVANNDGRTPLNSAAYSGHIEVVKLLLEKGADISVANNEGRTPLYSAAHSGHIEVVKLLLENGADTSVATNEGWTPLYSAAHSGHIEVVKLLLEKGADTSIATNSGRTPLNSAAYSGHIEVVKLLLENGADTSVATNEGWTPLNSAAYSGHIEVVKLLLEKGADISVATNEGWTPLNLAAHSSHIEVVKLLLEKGADISVANNKGWTPLNSAADSGHIEVVKLLLEKGADISVANNKGWTPLHRAAGSGHIEVVENLLRFPSIDANVRDSLGRTALSLASRFGRHQVVQALLATGRVDVDSKDWCGSTALFAAVANGHLHVVELLVAGSTAVAVGCHLGRSLLWWARRAGNIGIIKLVLQHTKPDGSSNLDETVSIDGISIPFDHESAWCDACTLGVPDGGGYPCRECEGFLLCGDCFHNGIRCSNTSHVCSQRILPG